MARKKTGITEPQKRTLREICDFIEKRCLPPTMKELAEVLNISHSSAHEQVKQLTRKGYLKREPRKARSIVVIKTTDESK